MRKIISLLVLAIGISACTFTESPEFVKSSNVKIIKATATDFVVETLVVFHNPNNLGGILQAQDIKVYVDDIHVADVISEDFKVPSKNEFTVPLTTSIAYKKVFNSNKNNFLGNVINMISNKNVTLSYKGNLRYKLGGFHYDYPIDYQEEISLSKE